MNWKTLAFVTILAMTGCAAPSEPRVVLQLAGYGVAFRVTQAPSPTVRIKAVLRTSAACVLKTSGEVVYHNDTILTVAVGELRHLGARIPASQNENHCVGDPQPGTDTFTLYFEDKKLAEKTIEVYRE